MRDIEGSLRERGGHRRVRLRRDEERHIDNALGRSLTMRGWSIAIVVMVLPVAVDMRMNTVRGVMVAVMIVEVRVKQRRRQRGCLKCDAQSESEETPAHGLILLEGLVIDRTVGPEFVREVVEAGARQRDGDRRGARVLPVPAVNA